jgi:hypothetical protein
MVQPLTMGRHSTHVPAIFALLSLSCSEQGSGKTMPGIEDPRVLQRASAANKEATVIWSEPVGRILAVSFSKLTPRLVFEAKHPIRSLAGPDEAGHLVFTEIAGSKLRVCSGHLDGRAASTVLESSIEQTGAREVGDYLALAPAGSRLAVLRNTKSKQMPRSLVREGFIEVCELLGGEIRKTKILALEAPMTWAERGRSLVFSRLVPRDQVASGAPGRELFGEYLSVWTAWPTIWKLDIESGTEEFLAVGWESCGWIARDRVMIGGWPSISQKAWLILDLSSRECELLILPGVVVGPVGGTNSGEVLYRAWPIAGSKIQYAGNHSPLARAPQMVTIKLLDPTIGVFATVVPVVDPRTSVSFGIVEPSGR